VTTNTAGALERLVAAGADVERACVLLTSPSPVNLEASAAVLSRASSLLSECGPLLHGNPGRVQALEEARRLRTSIQRADKLLASAAQYHARWSQIVGIMTGGYTPAGEPAAVVRPGRLCLQG